MRFRTPFDDVQWNAAAKHYSDMRAYVHTLRDRYPPNSRETRDQLKRLRELVQDFARELLKPHGRIHVPRLNRLSAAMIQLSVDYIVARETPDMR